MNSLQSNCVLYQQKKVMLYTQRHRDKLDTPYLIVFSAMQTSSWLHYNLFCRNLREASFLIFNKYVNAEAYLLYSLLCSFSFVN